MTVLLERGYAAAVTRKLLAQCGMTGEIAPKGAARDDHGVTAVAGQAHQHKKLVWCTERRATVPLERATAPQALSTAQLAQASG